MSIARSLSLCLAIVALSIPAIGAEEESTSLSILGGLANLDVPADFKKTKAANRIIEHEFQASVGEGDDAKTARVTMMAAGGGIEANIKRWQSQFKGGDPEDQKTEDMKLGEWKVYIVDVTGSFGERVGGGGPFAPGKTVQREDYAMAGAILLHPEGRTYFVKMIGPADVVKANRKAFVKMIKSVDK